MLQKFLVLFILLSFAVSSFAQEVQTDAERKIAQMQQEIDLLKKRQEVRTSQKRICQPAIEGNYERAAK